MKPFTAIFDSGVGGLTVLRACARRCPGERFGYFGDNANAPYGNRAPEEIERLAFSAFSFLARYPLKAAVVACNTVTAVCVEKLRAAFPFPIVGMEPAVRPAVAAAGGGEVLLLATRATLESARVKSLSEKTGGNITPLCLPTLAGEIERHMAELSAVDVEGFLRTVQRGKYAAAVLGCTHYVFVKERIAEALGCPVFDGNSGTADHLSEILNIRSEKSKKEPKNCVFFIGKAKNANKTFYFAQK